MTTNSGPQESVIFVKLTKICTNENKAIHSIRQCPMALAQVH